MRLAGLGLLSASLCACSSPPAFLSSDGLQSAVLITDGRTAVQAEAISLSDEALLRDVDPEVTLYALGYATPLDRLGLQAGALELAEMGAPMPPPDRIDVFERGAWSRLGERPPRIAKLALAGRSSCPSFAWTRLDVPEMPGDAVTVVLSIDLDRVFIATLFGRFYVATEDRVTAVTLSSDTPRMMGARAGGELWLVDALGGVVHGDPERGFVAAPALPFAAPYGSRISGSPEDVDVELFAIDPELRAAHFDGVAWRTLRDTPRPTLERPRQSVGWVAPGLSVITGAAIDSIEELHASGLSQVVPLDIPPRPSIDAPWNAAVLDGFGATVGTRNSVLFARDGGAWRRLVLPSTNPRADVMLGLGDGRIIAGGENSFFVAWRRDGTTCDVGLVPVGGGVHEIVRVRGGFFATASKSGGPTIAVWATELP